VAFFLAAMDGRHAENAGAFFGCPGMARMQEMQEHFPAHVLSRTVTAVTDAPRQLH
jgi:hypothetical protein